MKRLLLVRHAKASKDDPRLKDFDRPLHERGAEDAPEMGRRLARRGLHPGLVISSPAQRALETAKLIARELDFPWKEIRREKRIYDAEAETLLDVIREIDGGVESALLVGHNPGFTELGRLLARDFQEDLPTAAVLALDFAADTWRGVRRGGGTVLFYDYPKKRS